MTEALITLYKTLLFNVPNTTPPLKTYAIVDSIRDEKVKEKILFSGLNTVDLWHEELFENEQEVPLYLIEIDKENELLDYLLNNHKESIATYFISPYSLETLQTYYSMFTHVNIEIEENNVNKGIFGFYDPNILANYIQTLYTEEKVDAFFAGVAMWLSPSVEKVDELYIAFRDKEGEVDDVNLDLTSLLEEENPSLNFDNVSLPTLANLEEYTHEVEIDSVQVKMFDDIEKVKFCKKVLTLLDNKGQLYSEEEKLLPKALKGFEYALQLGLNTEATQGRFIWLWIYIREEHFIRYEKVFLQIKNSKTEYEKVEIIDGILEKMQLIEGKKDEV